MPKKKLIRHTKTLEGIFSGFKKSANKLRTKAVKFVKNFCSSVSNLIKRAVQSLRRQKRRKIVLLSLCCMLVVGFASFFGIQIYIDRSAQSYLITAENAPQADAVMILGAFVYESGSPSHILRDRLDYGYELYSKGKVKKILVSGDHGTKDYDEVNVMKDYLMGKGVPREDIFLDHAGFNTYDSMYRAKEIFGIETMLVSTQHFHISRSVYIARKLGIDAYGYASEDKAYYNMNYLNFRESFAKIKAFADTDIFRRKPKYLGDTIPITGSGVLTEG